VKEVPNTKLVLLRPRESVEWGNGFFQIFLLFDLIFTENTYIIKAILERGIGFQRKEG